MQREQLRGMGCFHGPERNDILSRLPAKGFRKYKEKVKEIPGKRQFCASICTITELSHRLKTSNDSMSKGSQLKEGFYRIELNKTVWEVPERYQLLAPVGSGAYGQVW